MANTLDGLLPSAFEALDVISREMTGFIPAVSRSSTIARAAKGDDVTVPVTPEATSYSITPGVTAPDNGDQTIDNVKVTISQSEYVPIRWNGEETKSLQNAGTFSTIMADRLYQAMRKHVNDIERDLWLEAYKNASRAYGAAGTTPFATAGDMSDFAGALGILEVNGTPANDLQMVLGHAAVGNLRGKQANLFKVNEAGSSDMLRNGMTDRIMNFAIRHSHQIGVHTKGTGSGYLLNDASSSAKDTVIEVDTGTGTVLAGDIVTFAGTSDKYVVNTTLAGTSFAIGKPGLLVGETNNDGITVGNSYTANVAFARSAIVLATRAPAMPEGGDMAEDVTTITDPMTGLTFELALYEQFRQNTVHVSIAWGQRAIKPNHIALLVG